MAITVVGTPTSTGNAQHVTSIAPAVPTGAASGDIAVVFLGQAPDSATVVTPPSGFTRKGSDWSSGNGAAQNSIWWKRLTGSDTGTYSFSFTVAAWTTAECVLFRGGAAAGDPWDAVATPITGNPFPTTIPSMSVTTTDANGALFWAIYNDDPLAHTPPTGFTEAIDDDCGSCAYAMPGSAGSQSAANATLAAVSVGGAWLGALLSAGGGPTPDGLRLPVQTIQVP